MGGGGPFHPRFKATPRSIPKLCRTRTHIKAHTTRAHTHAFAQAHACTNLFASLGTHTVAPPLHTRAHTSAQTPAHNHSHPQPSECGHTHTHRVGVIEVRPCCEAARVDGPAAVAGVILQGVAVMRLGVTLRLGQLHVAAAAHIPAQASTRRQRVKGRAQLPSQG